MIEAIISGQLFKGKAAAAINDVMRQCICSLFCLWKLVKAADVSSIGGFTTSTINALSNVVDENGNDFFPPSTIVNQSSTTDHYGMEVIGYHHKDTKYGEVYYLNFEMHFVFC